LSGSLAVGERDELAVARLPLDQGRDRARELAEQKVPFPVARDGAVFDLGRALGEHHHVRDLALALVL